MTTADKLIRSAEIRSDQLITDLLSFKLIVTSEPHLREMAAHIRDLCQALSLLATSLERQPTNQQPTTKHTQLSTLNHQLP